MNRADPVLLDYMKFHIDSLDATKGADYDKAKKFGQILLDNCELWGEIEKTERVPETDRPTPHRCRGH
jgi:hypothetical protein